MMVENLDEFVNMALRLLGLEKVQHMLTQTKLAAATEQVAALTRERDAWKAQLQAVQAPQPPQQTEPGVN